MTGGELLPNGKGRVKSEKLLDKEREGSFSARLLIRVKPVLPFAFTLYNKGKVSKYWLGVEGCRIHRYKETTDILVKSN